ncbi:MAG: pyridoxamine 5'-phosphate oxidase [Deltaproteobacteria bacterium]|jgi:pyridoxamine 5'-phosphate oxidase|nr:pyridoxamine 5'-phosphate oxidase [Deltaproteobacteria bacterium]MBT4630053.1 pyridoxamine 5'-phosphate oxidase [Deltaproteobacteria bacterium]MBT5086906.1 pyridoxamine 5'-phosphate oxidase [Deltaproteobacteria bacterium]MBT5834365.1 pyridoxamine 5'-phosphate oxidase [Deltaproteobacteria bacterium]|tara:strand:+ start:2038 stop:2673 length:636 start_codon:yes stop_codon:yes gene_type:complete
MDLTFMRQGYQNEGLSKEELSPDPFLQFEAWFKEANETEPIPNAMSLATVNHSGSPMMRTVLLKLFDDNGFVFFTNYKSRKAEQISENQNVAVLFNWVALERQVSINGVAEKVERSESLKYFMGRPRGSQLGAWVSDQHSVLSSRKILEMKLDEIKRKFGENEIPLPEFWGGFRIKPKRFEFWQGRPNRLHDRFLYSKIDDESWKIERLAP